MNAKHSAKSCEHGTPTVVVELARYVLGSIELDPASTSYWNDHIVRARQFYDRERDGLKQPWFGNVWLNPPGADEDAGTANLVRPFWERLLQFWKSGAVSGALYHGYSLEQLQMLQSSVWSPIKCVTLIYSKRLKHLRRPESGGSPEPGTNPTHANFTSLLPNIRFASIARQQVERFVDKGSKLGQIVRPVR